MKKRMVLNMKSYENWWMNSSTFSGLQQTWQWPEKAMLLITIWVTGPDICGQHQCTVIS